MSFAHIKSSYPRLTCFAPYIVLVLATLGVYANAFQNEFLFDDDLIIKINSFLKDWGQIGNILTSSTTAGAHIDGGFYRPLQILLYLVAYQAGDGGTFWFHALNIGLHTANACLMFRLGTKLGFNAWGVFAAALLWGLHPIHTEAITYMSGTADPLYVFFGLWALVILVPRFSLRQTFLVIPLLALAIASKETAVVIPAMVLICLFLTSPERFAPRTYIRTWPLWAIAIAYALWRTNTVVFDGPARYALFYDLPGYEQIKTYASEPMYRIYTFLATLPEYAKLLIWPTNLHMERVFPVQTSASSWLVISGAVMVAVSAGLAIFGCIKKQWMALTFGLIWFGAAHMPNSGLIMPVNSLFLEHWMYLPSIGLFLAFFQIVVILGKNAPRAIPIMAATGYAAYACLLGSMTVQQNRIWHNPVSFYNNIFDNGQSSPRARNNLALYYSNLKDYDSAIEQFEEAIRQADIYAETRYNLAITYLRRSSDRQAIETAINHLKKSIELQPTFFRSYDTLGNIYKLLGEEEKAALYKQKSAQIQGSR